MFFWNSLAFSMIQRNVGNLVYGSSAFSKSSLNIWKFSVHVLLKPRLENSEHYFASVNALVIANTVFQQHKRRLYTERSPDGQYWNQIDYILCSQRWRRSIQSAKTRLGADCGSDHELLLAKFRLKLKKLGKNTRPFRYDLNQIPYYYTVEVTNRFKESDLTDKSTWRTVDRGSWHCTGGSN